MRIKKVTDNPFAILELAKSSDALREFIKDNPFGVATVHSQTDRGWHCLIRLFNNNPLKGEMIILSECTEAEAITFADLLIPPGPADRFYRQTGEESHPA